MSSSQLTNPRIISETRNFMCMTDGTSSVVLKQPTIFQRFTLWTWTMFLSSQGNNNVFVYFWCFNMLRRRLALVRHLSLVLSDKDCFSYHVRPLTQVLMNYLLDRGLINLHLLSGCPHWLPWMFIDMATKFRRLDNVISLTMLFYLWNGCHNKYGGLQFALHFKDKRPGFENAAISNTESSSENETIMQHIHLHFLS